MSRDEIEPERSGKNRLLKSRKGGFQRPVFEKIASKFVLKFQ
jgi:hypothetical protein